MIANPVPPVPADAPMRSSSAGGDAKFLEAAQRLEALFLSELLKPAEAGSIAGDSVNSNVSQFASMLTDATADSIAGAGGLGLAETLFRAMVSDNENI